MHQRHFITEEEYNNLPEKKFCITCGQEKLKTEYSLQYRNTKTKQSWSLRSSCKICLAKKHQKYDRSNSEQKVFTEIAPLQAAYRLLEQNPKALAELIQRNRVEYVRLLEEERIKLSVILENRRNARQLVLQELKANG